jgi:alcohol dehydrogenase, propanol-preferring
VSIEPEPAVRLPQRMRAWAVTRPGPLGSRPLRLVDRAVPAPSAGQVLLRVEACGVCRTDLHLCEGDLAPRRLQVVPGHQVVGTVVSRGRGSNRFDLEARVGAAWLASTCGACSWCRAGEENLCPRSEYTGWDRDGGFAEYVVVEEAFVYTLPAGVAAADLAPLLCAGIIGYRALRRSALPPGGRLGIYGFGSSAHITAQLAMLQGAEVAVMTRGERNQQLARELGASFVGQASDAPPLALDSAIVFAPAGELVPPALRALRRGGTLAIAGIHLSDIPALDYEKHLFYERDLRSVTSNTRRDGEELLALAAHLPLRLRVSTRPFSEVDEALRDVRDERVGGSVVVVADA